MTPPPNMLDSANHPGVPHRDEFGGTHCPACGCVDGNGLSPSCPVCGWTASGVEVVLYGYGIEEEEA